MIGKYLYYTNIDMEKPTGIQKKILCQLKVFNKKNNRCELYYIESEKKSKFRFFLGKIPILGSKFNKWKFNLDITKLDYLYIRRPSVFDSSFIKFLKKIKQSNMRVKIIVEIPTYPYDSEYGSSVVGKFYLAVDKLYRRKLKNVVDRFAVVAWTGEGNDIWGVPVIPIYNGIDLDIVKKKKCYAHKEVNLLCIAYFSPWHGYEKFIEALYRYYEEKTDVDIMIHMVGIGPELSKYQEMVDKYNLQDYIIFYGELNEGIDEIYEKVDIGVCSIGSNLFGVKLNSQLKSREYLAKGLPIISAGDIDILQGIEFPFEYKVDPSQPIDLKSIIHVYQNTYAIDPQVNTDKIRVFAEKTCSWSSTMSTLLEYLGI